MPTGAKKRKPEYSRLENTTAKSGGIFYLKLLMGDARQSFSGVKLKIRFI